jgi:DNA repair protein RecO (recombination protein O)
MDTSDACVAPVVATEQPVRRPDALRVANEPSFVLHTYPYKETSLIVEMLSRHYGRVALVARGAKRPRSTIRGVLQGFQPVSISWYRSRSSASELKTLTGAEWLGGLAPLRGNALLCGFYLNELLLKLLARDDAHEAVFDEYLKALAGLSSGHAPAPVLRAFECALLREAGYAMQLTHCAHSGEEIAAERLYRYLPEVGPVQAFGGDFGSDIPTVAGKTLTDIAKGDYADAATLLQSKLLMRHLLGYHLAGQTLNTRQMMIDLQNL